MTGANPVPDILGGIMGVIFLVIFVISLIAFIISLTLVIMFHNDMGRSTTMILLGNSIACLLLGIFCLIQDSKVKIIATYNEYEYDIKAMIADLPQDACIKYKSDDTGMMHIQIAECVYPIDHQYVITIYNCVFNDQNMSQYKLGD